jgi:hypothetical protein
MDKLLVEANLYKIMYIYTTTQELCGERVFFWGEWYRNDMAKPLLLA